MLVRDRHRGGSILGRAALAAAITVAVLVIRQVRQRRRERKGQGADGILTTGARSFTIQRPPEEIARLFRDQAALSLVFQSFGEVSSAGENEQLWKFNVAGLTLAWRVQFVQDVPGELLRWTLHTEGGIRSEGWLKFRPAGGDWGTAVTLNLGVSPGNALVTGVLLRGVLRRLKALAETGEVPTLVMNPSGRVSNRVLEEGALR